MTRRELEISPPPQVSEAGAELDTPDPFKLTLADNPWLAKLREAPVDEAWLAQANEIIPVASTELIGIHDIAIVQRVDEARETFYGTLLGLAQPWRRLHKAFQIALLDQHKKHLPLPSVFIESQRLLHEHGVDNGKLLKNHPYGFKARVGPLTGLIAAIQAEGMLPGEVINANAGSIEMSGTTFSERLDNGESQGFVRSAFVGRRVMNIPSQTLNSRLRRADRFATCLRHGDSTQELRKTSNDTLLMQSDEKTFFLIRVAALYEEDMTVMQVASIATTPAIAHMATVALDKPYTYTQLQEVGGLPANVKQDIVAGFIEQRQAERKKAAKELGFVDTTGEGDESRLKAEPIDKIIRAYQRYVEATEKRNATRTSKK